MNAGDRVENNNYKRGYKVKRGETWPYPPQDNESIYGVILNHPGSRDEECTVLWIDNHNHALNKYTYCTGRDNQFDLVFAEDTVDYSIDDMFADLDALAERFS